MLEYDEMQELQLIDEQNVIFSETKYEERKKRKQRKREMKQEIKGI